MMNLRTTIEGKSIAILQSEGFESVRYAYLVQRLTAVWREHGATVFNLFGVRNFVPADLVFVHVDLSRVPQAYQDFAGRYPRQINMDAVDIEKSGYCPHLLQRTDNYDGPVIVKSNLNHAGRPERKISSAVERTRSGWSHRASKTLRTMKRLKALDPLFKSKKDYRIFSSLSEVSDEYFSDDSVIQKFLPEKSGDEYVVREYYFLNDAEFLIADVAEKPVFSGGRTIEATTGPAPAELQELRRKLNLEFGKIDYVLRDGKVVVFDANKTVGTLSEPTPVTRRTIDTLARGILSSFQNQPARH